MRRTLTTVLISFFLVSANDEFEPQGTYYPPFFAELLDAEMYSADTLYMVGVGGFVFMNVKNISDPKMIGRLDPGSIYKRFYNGKAAGQLAIGAARTDGLYFINITDLNEPGMHTIHHSDDVSYESVDFRNGYAYAAVHELGLEIFDISNPSEPGLVSVIKGLENAWDVTISGNHLYVADGPGGLKIYHLDNPAKPELISSIQTSGYSKEVIVADGMAYLALGAAGFDIIDVSSPENPVFKSNYNHGFGILNHLNYSNGVIFAASWELVSAIDVSEPSNPVLLATEQTRTRAMGIAVYQNEVYVTDWGSLETYTFQQLIEPDIHIKPTVFDFGYPGANVLAVKDFSIHNMGDADLLVSDVSIGHEKFDISETNFVVGPGEAHELLVSYKTSSLVNINTSIQVQSNDPDEETKRVQLYAGSTDIVPGERAPNFTLDGLDGKSYRLSDYKGKVILLAFFASW